MYFEAAWLAWPGTCDSIMPSHEHLQFHYFHNQSILRGRGFFLALKRVLASVPYKSFKDQYISGKCESSFSGWLAERQLDWTKCSLTLTERHMNVS